MAKVDKKLVRWEIKVPSEMNKEAQKAIERGDFASRADLVRDSVRNYLKDFKGLKEFCLGFMNEAEFREMHVKQEKFMAEHNGLTPAELIRMTEKEAENSGFLDEWKKQQAKISEDIERIRKMP